MKGKPFVRWMLKQDKSCLLTAFKTYEAARRVRDKGNMTNFWKIVRVEIREVPDEKVKGVK